MARLSFLNRRQPDQSAEGEPVAAPPAESGPAVPRRPLPHPGQLRRERRALLRAREERIRDLGGLVLEMYRRDQFRQDLVFEGAADLVSLEGRLHELDQLLAASLNARRVPTPARCECGAPIIWGSHFCANCGRGIGESPVIACQSCGTAVPADAKFCATCGTAVPSAPAPEPEGALAVEQPASEGATGPEAAPRGEDWEQQ